MQLLSVIECRRAVEFTLGSGHIMIIIHSTCCRIIYLTTFAYQLVSIADNYASSLCYAYCLSGEKKELAEENLKCAE